MSIKAIHWALYLDLPPTPKLILIAIADHADDEGICWPGLDRVALKASVNRRTVMRNLMELEEAGYVSIEPRTHPETGVQLPNLYRLHLDSARVTKRLGRQIAQVGTDDIPQGDIPPARASESGSGLSEEPSEDRTVNGHDTEVDTSTGEILDLQPEWVVELLTLPVFKGRLLGKAVIDIERDFASISLALEARSFVAWWSEGRRQLQRPMAAWRTWLRKAQTYQAPSGGGDSPDPLDAYRKSYGRYIRPALASGEEAR